MEPTNVGLYDFDDSSCCKYGQCLLTMDIVNHQTWKEWW